MLGAKDYLLHALTGELATDPSTATGYGCFDLTTGAWNDASPTAGSPLLPAVVPSSAAFPLLATWSRRWGCAPGTPVVVGAADSVLGAQGLGVTGRRAESRDRRHQHRHHRLVARRPPRPGLPVPGDTDGRRRLRPRARPDVHGVGDRLARRPSRSDRSQTSARPGRDGAARRGADRAALSRTRRAGRAVESHPHGLIEGSPCSSSAELARGLVAGIVLEVARCVAVLREVRIVRRRDPAHRLAAEARTVSHRPRRRDRATGALRHRRARPFSRRRRLFRGQPLSTGRCRATMRPATNSSRMPRCASGARCPSERARSLASVTATDRRLTDRRPTPARKEFRCPPHRSRADRPLALPGGHDDSTPTGGC